MTVGGWSSYSAIEPYLNEPIERRIGEVFGQLGCGGGMFRGNYLGTVPDATVAGVDDALALPEV